MRKLFLFLIVISLLFSVSISANAFGGYYVKPGEKVFHSVLCDSIIGSNFDNLIWYKTEKAAANAGYKIADCCSDYGFDYSYDGSTVFASKNEKIQNAFEIERMYGILDAYDELNEEVYNEGYDEGYDLGYDHGCDDGYDSGYEAGFEKGVMEAERKAEEKKEEAAENRKGFYFTIAGLVGFSLLAYFFDNTRKYKK